MPYIDAKVNVSITAEQEKELKTRLGKAIEIIPGKSESWLMIAFEDACNYRYLGHNSVKFFVLLFRFAVACQVRKLLVL